MNVLLPSTMVKHCVSFLWSLSGFSIMPKEDYMDVLMLNYICPSGPGPLCFVLIIVELLISNKCKL